MKEKKLEKRIESCPVCGGGIRAWRSKVVNNDKWQIDLCSSCGYAFVNPRPSFEYLMEFYRDAGHQSHHGETEARKGETLQSVLQAEAIYPNAIVDARRIVDTVLSLQKSSVSTITDRAFLDVGCGYGFFSKVAQERGFRVTALELADTERNIASQMLGIEPVSSSFEDYAATDGDFNVILMSQILEHALDVNAWIKKASKLLQYNGFLIIALPNFGSLLRLLMQEREPFICPPAHLNFFRPESLKKLLEKHGFQVIKTQWISRIPKKAFQKRFGNWGAFITHPVAKVGMSLIDALRLGSIINVYARKLNGQVLK